MRMCEPNKRATYTYSQETKLVRIVIDHVGPEYKFCIQRILDLVKVQRLIQSAQGTGIIDVNNVPDTHERSFSDDWLPSWKLLQASLITEYRSKLKARAETDQKKTQKEKLPVATLRLGEVKCYACGGPHKKGDPSCKAAPFDVHDCAPKEFREKQETKKRKYGGKGGNDDPKAPSKKHKGNDKKHCTFFNFGKGTCRFGAKCRFLHEDRTGGKGGKKGNDLTPSQNKLISSMVASTIKKKFKEAVKKSKELKKAASKNDYAKDDNSDDDSDGFAEMMAAFFVAPVMNTIPREQLNHKATMMASYLHSVDQNCGIDTDAGMSISTLRKDFIWLKNDAATMRKLPSPAGISGGESSVGGVGPMVIRAKSGEYLFDPEALFLKPGAGQPNFRVLSAQRLKSNGVRLVQCYKGTDDDVLQDRRSKRTIKLAEEGPKDKKILVLETIPCDLGNRKIFVKEICEGIVRKNRTALVPDLDLDKHLSGIRTRAKSMMLSFEARKKQVATMIFNEAKCSDEERSRLYVRRLGYCNSMLFPRMIKDKDIGDLPKLIPLNEDNPVNDSAKFKKKTHKRVPASISMDKPCWFRVFVDGYGGGGSMGCESYEGAIGGYLFVCPSTGDMHHKLYATHEQFPAALFQFLVHVESEGYRCHELYCDTFSVNISAEVDEILALFKVRAVPVSAGTPQEVSFVETTHRVVAQRSRAMLLGAPHLPVLGPF